ncbi:hypothetical protein [Bacillus sp. J37]|nr:hypothetical protein [Bacillus sp. J37]
MLRQLGHPGIMTDYILLFV